MNNYLCRIYNGTLQYISLVETKYSAQNTSLKSQRYKVIEQFYSSHHTLDYSAFTEGEGEAVQSMFFDKYMLITHIFVEMKR